MEPVSGSAGAAPLPPMPPMPLVPLVAPLDVGLPDMELHAVSDNAHVKRMIHLDIMFS